MDRITGTDAANLMEAYAAVHAPKINEDQIWEEVEAWVNSLVEEGYDLSEYTWEDMYEEYLSEAPVPSRGGAADPYGATGARRQTVARPTIQRPASSQTLSPIFQRSTGLNIGPGGFRIGDRPVVPQTLSPIFQRPGQRVSPQRPAAQPPARPTAAPAPAASTRRPATQPGTPSQVRSQPRPQVAKQPPSAQVPSSPQMRSYNPLMQKTFGYQTGNAPDQIAAASAGGPPVPTGTSLATGSAANPQVRAALRLPPLPTATTQQTSVTPVSTITRPQLSDRARALKAGGPQGVAREKVFGLSSSFDPFDVVMGYLIDEGYAENEEAAVVIMANMSEEWKQSIVEAYGDVNPSVGGNPIIVGGKPLSLDKKTFEWTKKMSDLRQKDPTKYKKVRSLMGPEGWKRPSPDMKLPKWL